MRIDKHLFIHDPSRYTVYQMMNYSKNIQKIKLNQKYFNKIYLFKTKPFVDSLYNYVHVMKNTISKNDLLIIKAFFGGDEYRIKIKNDDKLKNKLLSFGFSFKDTGNIMVADKINKKEYNLSFLKDIKIIFVNNKKNLLDFKKVFSESFDCRLVDVNKKFGFLDSLILNKNNRIKFFILYFKNKPVSIGGYYAFDIFSVENIGTKVSFRGKGFAHHMMNFLLNEAKKLGYSKACLVASDSGARVYKDVGFNLLNKTYTLSK